MSGNTSSAERMRRSRERKRAGSNIVSLEATRNTVADLERLGWISEGSGADPQAISAGISALCEQALSQGLRPTVTRNDADEWDDDFQIIYCDEDP